MCHLSPQQSFASPPGAPLTVKVDIAKDGGGEHGAYGTREGTTMYESRKSISKSGYRARDHHWVVCAAEGTKAVTEATIGAMPVMRI